MIKTILLSIFTTLLITSGQILWKIGFREIGGLYLPEKSFLQNIFRVSLNGWIFSGFIVYAVATIFFMWLLSKYEISLVIPISSVSFIFSLIAGFVIFHEQISLLKIAGVVLIMVGIILIIRN